jgi:hypothetical protein
MITVPNFKDPDVTKFLVELMRELDSSNKFVLKSNAGNHSLLLLSPSLKVFEVKVSDAGALTVTKIQG